MKVDVKNKQPCSGNDGFPFCNRCNTFGLRLRSHSCILPGEKPADFEALRQEYYDEWMPEGVTEEHLVDDICVLRWKKRRLDQYDQIKLRQTVKRFRSANQNNTCDR